MLLYHGSKSVHEQSQTTDQTHPESKMILETMSTENRLMIQLLGQPRILWGDQPLTPPKLARVFMYYLACQKSMVGRSDLVVLFWPESFKFTTTPA